MTEFLSTSDLVQLVQRVFRPRPGDSGLAVLVDLPDQTVPDNRAWSGRRRLATDWWSRLAAAGGELGLGPVDLVHYRNVRRNNADLPDRAWIHAGGTCPEDADRLSGEGTSFARVFDAHTILVALTEFSATAPLKLHARSLRFRAASMPRFSLEMVPALRLDYADVSRRCADIKRALDEAVAARLTFRVQDGEHRLVLDLRHRTATASGGLLTEPGTAGNLPSGESYIVPYEGERPGDRSRSHGTLPLELEGELMLLRIEANRVVEVSGDGPLAARERREFETEPAYANVAELGLGVLAEYGVKPVGEILLDEKLGLHVAFGRSDHFGGAVGPADFRSAERVTHVDRVYIPEIQPRVSVESVGLELPGSGALEIMRAGRMVQLGG